MKKNMINLEALKAEIRNEIGTDAAYLAADYEGTSTYLCDAISERADSETSIYYSDIVKFISEHVEEVSDTIEEFGWDGCGEDLYKAGQLTEFHLIEQTYFEAIPGMVKYAAIMDLIYKRNLQEVTPETWEAITEAIEDIDTGSRFDEITDAITEVIEAEAEETETAGALDIMGEAMREGFQDIAAAAKEATQPAPGTATVNA